MIKPQDKLTLNAAKPLVSIIINNYNYGRYIKSAIDSALGQTYPNVEVVVVDDGSEDDSREIVKSYGEKIISVLKPNGGQASAFNAGFSASRGDIVCFLDSDDIFLPSKVEKIVSAFNCYKGIDWCFHPVLNVDTDDLERIDISAISETRHSNDEIDFRENLKLGKQPYFVPPTSALSFSRRILQKFFPIPEDQRIYVGDSYIAISALFLGKGCVIGDVLSLYRLHGDNAYSKSNVEKTRETFAKLHIVTGYWLRVNFPLFSKYVNVFFAKGLACFWLVNRKEKRYEEIINKYFANLSAMEKILLILRALYYYQKSLLFQVVP